MTTAILTAKGQITIPREIRELLGLHKGDRLDFHAKPDGEVVVTPVNLSVDDVFGIVEDEIKSPCSDQEIEEGIAKGVQSKWRR